MADHSDSVEAEGLLKDARARQAQLENANDELRRQASELRRLCEQLASTEHRERHRLANLLQDHIQQMLVGARLGLERLRNNPKPGEINERLQYVDDLLKQTISASRAMTVDLSPPALEFADLTRALDWLVDREQKMHRLTVHRDYDDPVVVDSLELRILVFEMARELLLNVARHAGTSEAELSLRNVPGPAIRLTVTDRGAGFDAAAMDADALADRYGLLKLKHRVAWNKGQLRIDSRPGEGCRVETTLPLIAAAPRAVAAPPPPGAPPRVRVLIADDHRILRDGLAGIVRATPGLELIGEAADGREAIDAARALRPDVIVMDISMPVLSGVEATKIITAELPQIRVIGLSMYDRQEMADAMYAAGAVAYLQKDGPADVLVDAIFGGPAPEAAGEPGPHTD